MAPKAKPIKFVDEDGHVTDGFFWRWPDPSKPFKEPPQIGQKPQQSPPSCAPKWPEQLADVRAGLTKLVSPYLEGPFSREQVYRFEKVGGEMRLSRVMDGKIEAATKMSTGAGFYRVIDEAETPEYAFAAMTALRDVSFLETLLDKNPRTIDVIVRRLLALGQLIERIETSAMIGRFALIGRDAVMVQPTRMRDARTKKVRRRREEKRQQAEAAIAAAQHRFPQFRDQPDLLKEKAAKELGVTKRTLNRWLAGK